VSRVSRRDFDPSDAVIDAVHALLDVALSDLVTSDEAFVECHLCGEVDSHTDLCPVPALVRWQRYEEQSA